MSVLFSDAIALHHCLKKCVTAHQNHTEFISVSLRVCRFLALPTQYFRRVPHSPSSPPCRCGHRAVRRCHSAPVSFLLTFLQCLYRFSCRIFDRDHSCRGASFSSSWILCCLVLALRQISFFTLDTRAVTCVRQVPLTTLKEHS